MNKKTKFITAFITTAFIFVQNVQAIEIQKEYINKNRPHQSLKAIGVVIHDTEDPGGTAQNNRDYFNREDLRASVHYFVDWNKIIQTIPENEVAWHAGPTANHKFLSIEICVPYGHDTTKFNKAYNNTVDLVVDMCERYGWTKSDIYSHHWCSLNYKETDHPDPDPYLKQYGKTMDTFKRDVANKLAANQANVTDADALKAANYLGKNVTKVQYLLNCFGYNLSVDGKCGRHTTRCIGYLQRRLGIGCDYLFGPKSMSKAISQLGLAERGCNCPNEVKLVQYMLGVQPCTGTFGDKTYNAVVNFQKSNGIHPDGRVGVKTYTKLINSINKINTPNKVQNNAQHSPAPKPAAPSTPVNTEDQNVKKAATYLGNNIKKAQYLLNCFGYNLTVDGKCGKHTTQCIGDLQKKLGLHSDYLFGQKTMTYAASKLDIAERGCNYHNENRLIQYILNVQPMDGKFGNKTYAAVTKFQRSHGIYPDGRVGIKTFSVMLK